MRENLHPAPLHRRAWRQVRRKLRTLRWRPELQRIMTLRGLGQGRRAFLVGSGPSLNQMDLSRLEGEFVCLVNTGVRLLGREIVRADMHVVNDIHCYRSYGDEIEAIAARHPNALRFLNLRMKRRWRAAGSIGRPHFLINNPRKLIPGHPVPDLADGIVTGPSVLLSAAVLLDHMGFQEVYVIGCDLDYVSAGPYFYRPSAIDAAHEAQPDVAARRSDMAKVNAQFAVLRADFERRGRGLFNAGIGGNLDALQRVDFTRLFGSASA
jgi:hypothetical protein